MDRREFIIGSAAACVLMGALPISGCTSYKPVTAEIENDRLKIKKADFGENNWVVVKPARTNAPVLLTKNENGTYSAVLMECTHKQCEVKPSGNVLICPCHGAEFSLHGKVLKEPAEKDLHIYTTSLDEIYVYIHLK